MSQAKRGYSSKVPMWEIVNAILYKFKTGVQWSLLPCKSLISSGKIKYGAIYHHFRKWCKDGSWKKAWMIFFKQHKSMLDLSLMLMDGTHSPAKKGGESVCYQGRKKTKTSNTIWLADRNGNIVGFLPPLSGNHHDLYQLEIHLKSV
ncbi:transposase [Flexithrix dorotheae]|uniref:transposase n=1 Tax=Flexithrix dorotheae TaxID=70993 RepID=UPI0012F87565